ncbi:hypothetical protein EDD21DRAFT_371584 [Dissophora ornata]|nr:hypothetical protein EDD21DRAFT_371584 [Dissophora ornata]
MSTKPCAAMGRRECVRGFHRDECHNCTNGSVACNMCRHGSPSSASCIFCFDGRKECDDCYGLGFVQRICQDCIKEHYRRQGAMTKAKGDMFSLASTLYNSTTSFLNGIEVGIEITLDGPSSSSACSQTSSTKSSGKSAVTKISKVTSLFRKRRWSIGTYRHKWSRSASNITPVAA